MKMNMISTKAKKSRALQNAMPAVRSQATQPSGRRRVYRHVLRLLRRHGNAPGPQGLSREYESLCSLGLNPLKKLENRFFKESDRNEQKTY